MSEMYELVPGQFSLNSLNELLRSKACVQLSVSSLPNIEASYQVVQEILKSNETVYGINTGFGALANELISSEDLKQLQRNIVMSHACGVGALLEDDLVAIILLLKVNNLAQGYSGVRLELINALLAFYNHQIYPCIPSKGSVGASGDLAPLAHLVLPLLGIGHVRHQGQIISALEGLELAGLSVMEFEAKEGLALLNGLQVSTGIALKAYFDAEILFESALVVGALSLEAASGSFIPFDERIQKVRGHKSQEKVASLYRELLAGSSINKSHANCDRVQDPYSLRCQPQIMGAVLLQMQNVAQVLEVEINAVSDNPLVFSQEKEILSGGNFHGEIIAMACDNLALAIAEMGANSERRIALLIDQHFSCLPAFLVKNPGLNSGFMIAHVSAASCASDNKALAHPHSVDSLPTSANQEDHVSMATSAARRLHEMNENTAYILSIEYLAACQGLEFHFPIKTSPQLEAVYDKVRTFVEPYEQDRYFAPDIAILKQQVMEGAFLVGLKGKW